VIADDDGAVVVARSQVGLAISAARARAAKEAAARAAFRDGELGLDRYGLRAVLVQLGVEYVDYQAGQEMT
jgi:4-hydroxy-4-methyl-2-oxoglutarate aldolase